MQAQPERCSVDLSDFPDLVVVYLGFRVTRLRGVLALLGVGRGLGGVVRNPPDGLLLHESVFYGLTHIGMRQYWRDLDSLERFTRSEPHRSWWREFSRRHRGAGIWHESYTRNGMEGIYLGLPQPIGFARFAPSRAPEGARQSARERLAA